jgi:DNA modification methylase
MPATIPATSIQVPPDRQRQSFDDEALLELANSIAARGLIHAIVLGSGHRLIAGERRLRAITQHLYPLGKTFTYAGEPVPLGEIPYIEMRSEDPLELEEIELAENLVRKDLTWQELAEAHARLHRLRSAQRKTTIIHGEQCAPQTTADTAREIFGAEANNAQRDSVRQEILVAAHMDKPEVAKAPTLKEAFKALKKIEDADRNRALAAIVGATHSAADHAVIHADCLTWMAEAVLDPSRRFDVILTDPPYGMGAHEFGDAAGKLVQIDHQYDDSYESWALLMTQWCMLSYQIAKPEAHAYIFCDIDNFHELKRLMAEAGWYVFRTPFTNYKQNSGRVPLPDQGPRRQSEWFLYAIKGKKKVNFIGSDVIATGSDENLTHGAQKPVALYHEILRRSVKPGDAVLDTFGGTGTLLPAAHALKCRATVVEQSANYYGICLQRLADLEKQKELPL